MPQWSLIKTECVLYYCFFFVTLQCKVLLIVVYE